MPLYGSEVWPLPMALPVASAIIAKLRGRNIPQELADLEDPEDSTLNRT